MHVAGHASLGFKAHINPMNRTIDRPVHNDILGNDFSQNTALIGNMEGRTVQFSLDLAMDLNQTLGGNIPCYIQSFSYHCYVAPTLKHNYTSYLLGLLTQNTGLILSPRLRNVPYSGAFESIVGRKIDSQHALRDYLHMVRSRTSLVLRL